MLGSLSLLLRISNIASLLQLLIALTISSILDVRFLYLSIRQSINKFNRPMIVSNNKDLMIPRHYNTLQEMGKCYCDYCGVFLKNSSPFCRNEHNAGRKHKMNVAEYYRAEIVRMAQEIKDRIEYIQYQNELEQRQSPRNMLHDTICLGYQSIQLVVNEYKSSCKQQASAVK